jgi:hypothetical protein
VRALTGTEFEPLFRLAGPRVSVQRRAPGCPQLTITADRCGPARAGACATAASLQFLHRAQQHLLIGWHDGDGGDAVDSADERPADAG